jgi:acyl-coenzyme A thioesterase PaaI-like protein
MTSPKQWLENAVQYIPQTVRDTMTIRAFGAVKVPLILYCLPTVQRLDDTGCDLRIPLSWRTRNHYKSMYFGVLAIGADCTAGLIAMHLTKQAKGVGLLFKDFHADFHKRAMGDVVFTCNDGVKVRDMVKRAVQTGARINEAVTVNAYVPSDDNAHVATMTLTLSLKQSKPKGESTH